MVDFQATGLAVTVLGQSPFELQGKGLLSGPREWGFSGQHHPLPIACRRVWLLGTGVAVHGADGPRLLWN